MNRTERYEMTKQGLVILRAVYNHRKGMYTIKSHTLSGGWERFAEVDYPTLELADEAIDMLVTKLKIYRRDE
jgi:hypothetical protein